MATDRQFTGHFWGRFLGAVLLVAFGLPLLVFAGCLLAGGYGPLETLAAVGAQYRADRANLLIVGIPSLIPFVLLALILAFSRWRSGDRDSLVIAIAGGVPVTGVLAWANLSYWPLFLPGRPYPGWPHGLEMVIAPLYFAPVAMALGLLIAAVARRRGAGRT